LAFQVFVSYASLDDDAPPSGGDGFVSLLVRYLDFDFKQRIPRPVIWRDKDRIRPSDHFDSVIQEGVDASDVLLIVLSDNWLASEFCRHELELFRRKSTATLGRNSPVIVAAKHEVKFAQRPEMLGLQVGYKFFDDNDPHKPEFFLRKNHDAIDLRTQEIAEDVRERMLAEDPTSKRQGSAPAVPRRKIYLAKPAGDMTSTYARLTQELERRGYAVLPPVGLSIPLESTAAATAFVDEALKDAEVSIHLLGDKPGNATDDPLQTPTVKLQLSRAARRAADGAFRRLIWAPKILGAASDRDPLAVLQHFDKMVDSDKVDGREESSFVEYVVQHLADRVPRATTAGVDVIEPNSIVYVYYRREDEDYAYAVADALKKRQVQPTFPIFDDTDDAIEDWHRNKIAECDAIVVCWANAGEVWVSQQTPALKDWTKLGRSKRFSCRGVIAGPPSERKQSYIKKYNKHLLPPNEVDKVLDLTAYFEPPPEALDPLFPGTS
jgi:hypothetical protein